MSKLQTRARKAGGAFVPARHTVPRPLALLAAGSLALATTAGCGGGSKPSNATSASAPGSSSAYVPSGTAHAISTQVARSVPLGTPQSVFYARYGTPVLERRTAARGVAGGLPCGYYYAIGYTPTQLLWEICFYKGKLSTVASAIAAAYVSGGRLVLKPPVAPKHSKRH